MRRFWILFRTELKAWLRDPITALGGIIAPTVILVAFGLLFGGELSFPIAVYNHDQGPLGEVLRATIEEVQSPFNQPYYRILELEESEAMERFQGQRIDAVWVIPPDFTERVQEGGDPSFEMFFNNYIDDRAKNHRLYSAEVIWAFYEEVGLPGPPLMLREEYPLPEMIDWLDVIGVGLILLSVTIGSMFNIFMLTHKEQHSKITLELGLSPRSLVLALFPKVLLALLMGLLSGSVLLLFLHLWTGFRPGGVWWAAYVLCALVALFWIGLALIFGLQARHLMAGAIGAIMLGVIVFFFAGGLGPLRYASNVVQRIAAIFPNAYAIDPMRDLLLFDRWPTGWLLTVVILTGFAGLSLSIAFTFAKRRLRRLG